MTTAGEITGEMYGAFDAEPDGCYASFTTGGFDPYGTSCELQAGHDGKHRGGDPFGNGGAVEWLGGGSCAGDPLPYREVVWFDPNGREMP